jgi:tetratricopeptide (TPR) repeat protein
MRRKVPLALLPFAAAILVHLGALRGGFHFDDVHSVVGNEALRDLRNLPRFFADASLFSATPEGAMYRPLTLALHGINRVQAGSSASPLPFLLTNLLLHGLASAALLVLARGLLRRAGAERADAVALGASLLFAVHPLASEAVNYVSARSSSLSTLFLFLAASAHLRAREGRPARVAAALAAGACALLSRETAIVLPAVIAAAELLLPGTTRGRIARTALYALLAGASLGLRQSIASGSVPLPQVEQGDWDPRAGWGRSLGTNLRVQVVAAARFLSLFVWPRGLSVDPPVPASVGLADPLFVGSALALVGCAVAAVLARRRPAVSFGASLAVVGVAPYFAVSLNVAMAEHRFYLPLAGLCLAATDAAIALSARWRLPRRVPATAAALVLAAFSARSAVRDADWRGGADDLRLWESALEVSPSSFRAQLGAGNVWCSRGDLERAEGHFREAIRIYPEFDAARLSLAATLTLEGGEGSLREAIAHLEAVLARRPGHVLARFKLALALQELHLATGDPQLAARCDAILESLAAENPSDPRAQALLREFKRARRRGARRSPGSRRRGLRAARPSPWRAARGCGGRRAARSSSRARAGGKGTESPSRRGPDREGRSSQPAGSRGRPGR